MKLGYLLAAMIVSLASIAHAQDGPSYEETVRFLKEKLNTQSSSARYRFIELDRCIFRASIESNFSNWDLSTTNLSGLSRFSQSDIFRIYNSEFNLENADLSRITSSLEFFASVTIYPRPEATGVSEYTTFVRPDIARRAGMIGSDATCDNSYCYSRPFTSRVFQLRGIPSPVHDNTPRVERAIRHLIQLCGGRGQLF